MQPDCIAYATWLHRPWDAWAISVWALIRCQGVNAGMHAPATTPACYICPSAYVDLCLETDLNWGPWNSSARFRNSIHTLSGYSSASFLSCSAIHTYSGLPLRTTFKCLFIEIEATIHTRTVWGLTHSFIIPGNTIERHACSTCDTLRADPSTISLCIGRRRCNVVIHCAEHGFCL